MKAMGEFLDAWWQQTYQVKSVDSCAHAQNYVKNGNIPGKSAAT